MVPKFRGIYKHHRFVLLEGSSSLGSGNEGKREIVLNRSELYRGKYMRSTKDQLVKKTCLFSSGWKYRCGQRTVRMAVVTCSQKKEQIELREDLKSRRGLAVSLEIICHNCGESTITMSSKISNKCYDVNLRLTYGMRAIGKGAATARIFCGLMNLPLPPAKFERHNSLFLNVLKTISEDSMNAAVHEAVIANDNNSNIAVAVDGTWHKRGYFSLNGVVCATSVENGKRIPKTVFVGIETLKFGVMNTVICFNDGYVSRIKVFEALGIKPGYNTERALLIIDNKRIFETERIVNKESLEARNKRRKIKKENG
ncbi:uncharacterized protein TNCV_39941 [Trichonephila clavipes]|nr:uncharacterized protein TNCV_39941 [Trichonephila clavipes]